MGEFCKCKQKFSTFRHSLNLSNFHNNVNGTLVISYFLFKILGEFIRDLVALESGGSGGVVWRIRANATKLVCAVGSRNGTEETKLLVLDFDVHDSK